MRVVITLWLVTIAHVGLGAHILINKILQSDKNGNEINSSSIVTNKGINQFESLPIDQVKSYRCDFENGLCSFLANSKDNKENWKPGRGKPNAADTGPSVDHTFGNVSGNYIFVNVSAAKTNEVSLETTVPLKYRYCVRFFYHMYGADIGGLTVAVRSGSTTLNYFKRSKTQGDRWKEALFSVIVTQAMKRQGYKVVFTAKHISRSQVRGDIALDDIELTYGKCPDTKRTAADLCSFDDYDCGYTDTRQTSLKWEWTNQNGKTSYMQSAPKEDHTLGTSEGGYWLVGTEGGIFTGTLETSMLSSPVYDPPKDSFNCLHFYYYMDGDGISIIRGKVEEAYLQVYAAFPDSKNGQQWIVSKGKNMTNHKQWTYVEAKAIISEKFQLQFTVGIKTKVLALIAIDDIKLVQGVCPEAGACDFEEDKCSWTDGTDQYNWLRKSGSSVTNRELGPIIDKTKGDAYGSYVVFNTIDKEAGSEASLESEFFPPGGDSLCLSFYYQMSGDDLGTLKVIRNEESISTTTLWILKNDKGSVWKKGMTILKPSAFHSNAVFRGITGQGTNGFMALDDINIRKGVECNLTPPDAEPLYEDPCTQNPCQNAGKCEINGESFECECVNPFSGVTCEIDPCTPNPCQNEGECIFYGESFQCQCVKPFSGETCEIDPCTSKPCQNAGVCKLDDDWFKCECVKPFSGETCQIDPCTSKPCQNAGICTPYGESFKCDCVKPFSGKTCEIDSCTSKPCQNAGICTLYGGSFKCDCVKPFSGKTCEIDCDCGEKSDRCVMQSDGHKTCFCQYGYAQINGLCSDCYCGENSESCYFDWKSNKVCICSDGYAQRKRTCEGTCLRSRDCLNGGVCRRDEGGDKFCRCRPNFRGDRCEISELCESLKPSCEAIGARCEVIGRKAKCECPSGKTFRPEFGRCEGYSNLWIASLVLLTVSASLFFISTTFYCCNLRRKKEKM